MNKHSWHDKHIRRTAKTLLKSLYATAGVFLFLFVIGHIGGALYISHLQEKTGRDFQNGIDTDMAYLREQGNEVAQNPLLATYVLSDNSAKLINLMTSEKNARHIGLMGVANSGGIIIGRTMSPGKLGENVFLVIPQGRAVAEGRYVQSVEVSGVDTSQLIVTTGRPIMNGGKMIGALFSNYLTDDAYSKRFRDTYLPKGSEVAFYTKEFGIYGSSFEATSTKKLINSYFNSGSDWIRNGLSDQTLVFKDGTYYVVKNIVFPGIEKSPGGALVFIPRLDISDMANSATALLTFLAFLIFALMYHVRTRGEERGWRYYVLLVSVSVGVFSAAFISLRINDFGHTQLEHIPYTLYNSTLRMQPESGIYDIDYEQQMSVMVDTGDEVINAIQLGLVFDPDMVELKSIEASTSTCAYVIAKSIDQKAGKASFACVILDSKGDRGSFPVANLVVVPKAKGTFDISFDKDETKVLASDGLGTDVLRMSQSGSYRIDKFDISATSTTNLVMDPGRTFVVFSPTHPNQSRWYNLNTAKFVWRGLPDAVYRYAFDTNSDTVPSAGHTLQDSSVTIPVPGDGIYYFHLQLVAGGPIAHYRIQSDATPPSIVSMKLSQDKLIVGDVARFSFEATDTGSGVQQNYYVDLGNHLFLPVGSELYIPFLVPGDQKVLLRVYDDAGNYSEEIKVVHVENQ
jgi:hypothetical protein